MEELAQQVGVKTVCAALGVPPSSRYAARRPRAPTQRAPAPTPPRALTADEKTAVRDILNSERFAEQAPREVCATLLDEGTYHNSVPTMYRILRENTEVQERRNQLRHPAYATPQLVATGPNQVWLWDTLAPERKCKCQQVAGTCCRGVFLPVRAAGSVQRLRGRLADRRTRSGYPG